MNSSPLELPLSTARALAIRAQLPDITSSQPTGKEGIAQTIERLGYVQIDTISVIARAHHHTLWVRRPDYDPEMLHTLQAEDRRVFEYWGHAASYLPIADYRFYLPTMEGYRDTDSAWGQRMMKRSDGMLEPVLERITAEGPLASKDFKPPPGTKRGTWWDWKPAKVALELLFWRGELMVTERRGFQRVYDLTERVLPSHVDTRVPTPDELGRFLVRRALNAYGISREKDIREHIRGQRDAVNLGLQELLDSGEVMPVTVEGDADADYFALSTTLENDEIQNIEPDQVRFLSPFDNLIIQRDRVRRLFDFDYTIECYTPAAKRKYGYFTLPILWGDRLVGRLDPKAERKSGVFLIRNLVFEPGFELDDAFLAAFAKTVHDFASFNGCDSVKLEAALPKRAKRPVQRALRNS